MVRVTHYVLKHIIESMDDIEALRENFDKFSKRYPQDSDFLRIYGEFEKYDQEGGDDAFLKIKEDLERLMSVREIGSSGGTEGEIFKDRRTEK